MIKFDKSVLGAAKALFVCAAIMFTQGVGAATAGSCQSAAKVITPSSSSIDVTLVKEYDEDFNEYTDFGCYYFKVTLTKGTAYSFSYDNEEEIFFAEAFPDPDNWDVWASFDYYDVNGKTYQVMKATDWGEYDPSSVTFYICLSGDVGVKTKFKFAAENPLEPGSYDNPKEITITEKETETGAKLSADENYYFQAKLKADRKYLVRTSGGADGRGLKLLDTASGEYDIVTDFHYADDTNNAAVAIYPYADMTMVFEVSGTSTNQAGQTIGLYTKLVPQRKIGEHPVTEIAVGESKPCTPGCLNKGEDYYDLIIDEELFKFGAEKGKRYAVRTSGAVTNLEMIVYDSNGKLIAENTTDGTFNTLCVLDCAASGTYYFGVRQAVNELIGEKPAYRPVTVELLSADPQPGVPDAADPADDVSAGATPLRPIVGRQTDDPETKDSGSGVHALGITDWVDTYCFNIQKGLSYKLAVSWGSGETSPFSLAAEVFTLNGTRETSLASEYVAPGSPMSFTAGADATCYVRLKVAQGDGLSFPPYKVHVMAHADGPFDLGYLTVYTKGAEGLATWSVKTPAGSGTAKYTNGVEILTWGTNTVSFSRVTGFSQPANETVVINGDSQSVTGCYSDTYDPKDDRTEGSYKVGNTTGYYQATTISPAGSVGKAPRTLFEGDVDCFAFTVSGSAKKYYKFWLDGAVGNPVFSITNALFSDFRVDGKTEVAQLLLDTGNKPYQLAVTHGGVPVDSSYTLKYVAYTPTTFNPTTNKQTVRNRKLVAGEAYHSAKLTAGCKYTFSATGVDGIYISGTDGLIPPESSGTDVVFFPKETGTYVLNFRGADEASYEFSHQVAKTLGIAQHKNATAVTVNEPVNVDPTFVHDPNVPDVWDGIVDHTLLKAKLERGKTYLVGTGNTPEDVSLVLYVYNSRGEILATSMRDGVPGSREVRALVEVATAGDYYFGLAQVTDEEHGDYSGIQPDVHVDILIEEVSQDDAGVPLSAVPGDGDPTEVDVAGGEYVGLDDRRWTRTYTVAARAGVEYRVKAKLESVPPEGACRLKARVYTKSGTQQKDLAYPAVAGDLTPEEFASAPGWLAFKATANATYYIEVSNADGKGLTTERFNLHCSAVGPAGTALGVLTVDMKGAPQEKMGWKIVKIGGKAPNPSESVYVAGASVLLVDGERYDIAAQNVSGFAAPKSAGFTNFVFSAAAGLDLLYKYVDTSDPKDDYPSGRVGNVTYAPVSINPSAKGVSVSRTLWTDDVADWFKFTATAGTYYNFSLTKPEGNAQVRVYGPDDPTLLAENVLNDNPDAWQICATKGTYYVKVSHPEEDAAAYVDCSYEMTARSAAVGSLKLDKTAISVKEDAAFVDVKVKRTAKDGKVRLKFRTMDVSARKWKEYYPTNGVLEWVDGDSKDKTVRVRLIPDLVPVFESNRAFTVEFERFDEADPSFDKEGGEYIPDFIGGDVATITLTEVTKKTPGTVQVDDLTGNPKKPTFTVTAGEKLVIPFDRVNGADGIIGVKVETVKGTANRVEGQDYESVVTNLVWADGGFERQTVTVSTKTVPGDYTASKAFSVRLTALTKTPEGVTCDRATLAASQVAVTILNEKFALTVTDYAKTQGKTAPVQLKEGKAGTWLVLDDGVITTPVVASSKTAVQKSDLTFTVTGPGRLQVKPNFEGNASLRYECGKVKADCVSGAELTVDVESGNNKTVKFIAEFAKGDAGCIACGGPTEGKAWFDLVDGEAYVWTPLPAAKALAPTVDKAVVAPTVETELAFEQVPGVSYNVYILDKAEKGKSVSTGRPMKLGDPETQIPEPYATNLVAGAVYTWRVDAFFEGGSVTNVGKVLTLTAAKEGAGAPAFKGEDVNGTPVTPGGNSNIPLILHQGVKPAFGFDYGDADPATVSYALVSGSKLPDGLKLVTDNRTKVTTIGGVPTKPGAYQTLVQVTTTAKDPANPSRTVKTAGTTAVLDFVVDPMEMAAGTFVGNLYENGDMTLGSALTNGLPRGASLTFSATTAGKLTGKLALAGKTYSFSGTGFDRLNVVGSATNLVADLQLVQKVGTVSYTNELQVTVQDGSTAAMVANSRLGHALLRMWVPDANGKGVQGEDDPISYAGDLYRDNTKYPEALVVTADRVGYYTMVLNPLNATANDPRGNGYLTVTFDKKGVAKVAGALADGTAVSLSVTAGHDAEGQLFVPVYVCKSPYLLVGEIVIRPEFAQDHIESVAGIVNTSHLWWYNDNAAVTWDGDQGFGLELEPVGSWYNTLYNLQRYYLDYRFVIDASDDLPKGVGYDYIAECRPASLTNLTVDVTGNAISVPRRTLVKRTDDRTLNDFALSVNPQNVTFTYKRETGLISGTFAVWTEQTVNGRYQQKEISGLKHAGVMIFGGQSDTFDPEAVTGGYFLMPIKFSEKVGTRTVNRTWNCSLPFNIKAVDEGGHE